MKIRRIIIIAGVLVVVAALASVAFILHWQHSQSVVRFHELVSAVQSYSRGHISRGQPIPSSVTLRDLVSGGYIPAKDVRSFDGLDVAFYPTVSDSNPQAVLVRVRMADGSQIVALADGSIQQLPR
jgi:Flp pilus assembly protein CpaB